LGEKSGGLGWCRSWSLSSRPKLPLGSRACCTGVGGCGGAGAGLTGWVEAVRPDFAGSIIFSASATVMVIEQRIEQKINLATQNATSTLLETFGPKLDELMKITSRR
jgi:hypothetical protein